MKTLIRCAGSSLASVALEFALLTVLVSLLGLYYLVGAVLSWAVYFVVSFLLNRRWAFRAGHASPWPQLLRHVFVGGCGMAIGTSLLWLQVHFAGLPYQVGWVLAGVATFFLWTFPMQRWFAFRAPAPVPVPVIAD